jgi:hypothetical protein
MTEVEIFWPAAIPPEPALDAQSALAAAGVEATCRLRPTSRGADLSVLVVLTGSALEPLLKTVFEGFGQDAYRALQGFVRRLVGRSPSSPTPAPAAVEFVSAATGARFVFTSGLPEAAFRAALAADAGTRRGRWVWDQATSRWLCINDGDDDEPEDRR